MQMHAIETPVPPAARRRYCALWLVTTLAALAAILALVTVGDGDQRTKLAPIIGMASVLFALLSILAWLLLTAPVKAWHLPSWLSVAVILLVAVGARWAILSQWIPTLSDDLFRYRHEGRLVLHGIPPYSYLPAEAGVRVHPYTGAPLGILPQQTDLLDRMSNNGEIPAIYFPVCQAAFAVAAWYEEHWVSPSPVEPATMVPEGPGRDALWLRLAGTPALKPYRFMSVVTDVLTIVLLLAILRRLDRSVWWAALYAWNPLVLIEVAGNAHFEPLGIVLLLAGLYAILRHRWTLATVLLALALMVKPIAILGFAGLVFAYWQAGGRPDWRTLRLPVLRLTLVYALTVILTLLPLAAGIHDWRITAGIVAKHFEFNGFVFDTLRWLVFAGNTVPVRPVLSVLNLVSLAYIFKLAAIRGWPIAQTLGHAAVVFLLFSPQVYPWYALWPLALAILYWNPAAWLLSLTVLLSYAVWPAFHATGAWMLPNWVLPVEWIPVVLLEAHQLWREAQCKPTAESSTPQCA